jgi:hypothetical protein
MQEPETQNKEIYFAPKRNTMIKTADFWNVKLCSLADGYQCLGDTCYFHLQQKRGSKFPWNIGNHLYQNIPAALIFTDANTYNFNDNNTNADEGSNDENHDKVMMIMILKLMVIFI